jgi:hypothetical protein
LSTGLKNYRIPEIEDEDEDENRRRNNKSEESSTANRGGGKSTDYTDFTDSGETWVLVQGLRNFPPKQNILPPEPLNKSMKSV